MTHHVESARGWRGIGLAARAAVALWAITGLSWLVPSAGAATLQQLLDGTVESLPAGQLVFSEFSLLSLENSDGSAPNLGLVSVEPLLDVADQPGLRLLGGDQLATSGLNTLDLVLQFRVEALPESLPLGGHTLELGDVQSSGPGLLLIVEELTDPNDVAIASSLVIADTESPFLQLSDTVVYPQPHRALYVGVNLSVIGLSGTTTAAMDSFTQRFSLVPEPSGTLAMLFALGLLPRRRRPAHSASSMPGNPSMLVKFFAR